MTGGGIRGANRVRVKLKRLLRTQNFEAEARRGA